MSGSGPVRAYTHALFRKSDDSAFDSAERLESYGHAITDLECSGWRGPGSAFSAFYGLGGLESQAPQACFEET